MTMRKLAAESERKGSTTTEKTHLMRNLVGYTSSDVETERMFNKHHDIVSSAWRHAAV